MQVWTLNNQILEVQYMNDIIKKQAYSEENNTVIANNSVEKLNYWIQKFNSNGDTAYIKEGQIKKGTAKRRCFSLTDFSDTIVKYCQISEPSEISNTFLTGIAAYFKLALGKKSFYIGAANFKANGDFEKYIPVQVSAEGESNFSNCRKLIEDSYNEAVQHSDFSEEKMTEIIYDNFKLDALYDVTFGCFTSAWNIEFAEIKENICISLQKNNDCYEMVYYYKEELFSDEEIEFFNSHLLILVADGIQNSDKLISELEMISEEEYDLLLNKFNDSAAVYPCEKTVVEFFEEKAEKYSDRIAVVYGNEKLTYREFNNKVNVIANKLRALGVKPDDFVALITDRSIELMIGIFGIIKSGGAYVPIDPTYPAERISFMLSDCAPKAIVVFNDENVALPDDVPIIDLNASDVYEGNMENPEIVNMPDDLIYCIYTSGTTGRPKGVMNRHQGIMNLMHWMQSEYPLDENDVVLQKTTYVFDMSVSEIFRWFIAGASIALLKRNAEKEPTEIAEEIERYSVTVSYFVPSMLSVFMDMPEKSIEKIKGLKYILTSGEAQNSALVKKFYKRMLGVGSKVRLGNNYGPTEASVYSTFYNPQPDFNLDYVPIGKPLFNMQVYILNDLRLCGVGVIGEL